MTLDAFAQRHLVLPAPRDTPVWHWTRAQAIVDEARRIIEAKGDFSGWTSGATGRGLYLSTSAVDLMERGEHVLFATLPKDTPLLLVDPELFGVGFPELLEIAMARLGWAPLPRARRGRVDKKAARPAPEAIEGLMTRLDLPCCVFVYGMHLAFMARAGGCLRLGPAEEQERTVVAYVKANPNDRPTLVPYETVTRWLAARGLGGPA